MAQGKKQDRSLKEHSRFFNDTIPDREKCKMKTMHLTKESRAQSAHADPVSIRIVSEYLKQVIIPGNNGLEIAITKFTAHEHAQFNTFGTARLEILFYEKDTSAQGREQVILYGIAENARSQLKSFTLNFDTRWLDSCNRHPEDSYFDSIIVARPGSTGLIPGLSMELSLKQANGMLAGYCAAALRFESARLTRAVPHCQAAPPSETPAASAPQDKRRMAADQH